jgi:hypothetical protein
VELTVVVDGTVLSGSVVAEHAWTQRQNDQVRIGSPAIAQALDSREWTAEEQRSARDEAGSDSRGQGPYLHFLGPVVLSGGARVPLQATRVDGQRISAWSIGRIPGD